MDQDKFHQMVSRIKDLAIELGKTPTKIDLQNNGVSDHTIRGLGGLVPLIQAAGLPPSNARKIDNSIFEKDIVEHLREYEENLKPKSIQEPFKKCLFIPDFHAPWGDMRIIEKACLFAEKNKPDYIIQLGDLYDFISHSRFPTSKNIYTPRDEQKAARSQAEEMFKMLHSSCKSAKINLLWGNHDSRPLKRILETYPEASDWVNHMIKELMTFPNVETMEDQRQELILPGNVLALHGYLSRPGSHRDYNLGFNVVHGHLHTAHVMFKKIQGKVLWEMNCGISADINSKAFSYTPQRSTNWSQGFGWLDENGPRFIPY